MHPHTTAIQTRGQPQGRAAANSDANRLLEFFRYHGVWAPGVRLFRAIGFRAKAAVISLLFCVPLVVLAWSYFGDKAAAIEFSAKERVGIAYLREASPLLGLLQRERQLALEQVAKGAELPALAEARQASEAQLKKLAATEALLGAALGTAPAHAALLDKSKALPTFGAGLDKNLAAHNERLKALLALMTAATDNSNLTLDPDLDSYYLMDASTSVLPTLAEATAQLRAVASAVADGATPSGDITRTMHAQQAVGDFMDERWAAGVEKVLTLHPELKQALGFDGARQALRQFHRLAENSESAVKLKASGDAATGALLAAQLKSLDMLDGLLAQRVGNLQAGRAAVSGVLVLSLALVLYFFMAFRKVLDGGLKEVAFHIDAMRDGDLTTQPRAWGADEAAGLMHTLAQMQASLRRIVGQVRGASDSIVSASTQIAAGANDLSSRTEQSASNLEETASTMDEIAATVKRGEETVAQATQLAATNADAAERGGRIVGEVVQTMQHINASSGRIGDIIGTIDAIAFQTNILALNAAVEAARAGEQGRGFAVVASEVRALAQRSAAAAREIKTLITASVEQADSGVRVVREAGQTIGEIVTSAQRMRQLLAEVAVGAREQTAGVGQSAHAVQELETVTQQNAALVEQTAAAAGALQHQAHGLAGEVARFRLPVA